MKVIGRLTVLFILLSLAFIGETTAQQLAQGQKRLALVIGNGNYPSSILANPENDAKDMSEILHNLGFDVIFNVNLGINDMRASIDEYGMRLKDYDVALFYFAGHGIQYAGRNYLVPADAKLTIERMIQFDCIEVDRVLAYMEEAKTKVNIIILDACRNNPFEKSWSRSLGEKGLAFMKAPEGTLIAYATSPGETASDGAGKNGLYTSAILETISEPDITIEKMFKNVRNIVSQKSQNRQTPWESTSLVGEFYFNPVKTPGQVLQTTPVYLSASRKPEPTLPVISDLTSSDATVIASIKTDGGSDVFDKGIYFSTSPEPSAKNGKRVEGEGGYESFSCTITGLAPNKTYYVRAYARNSADIAYSQQQLEFKTIPAKPLISTPDVSKITSSSAYAVASITDDGGAPILFRGFCWSTIPDPEPSHKDLTTQNGKGTGDFSNLIGFLLPDTTYYLRAYCSNTGKDTVYGNQVEFRTLRIDQFVDVEGNIYGSVELLMHTWMTENLRSTRLNDGTQIPLVTENAAWSSQISAAYCWYDNKEANKETYGALYNWEAVKSGKLCPAGWHIPTDEEWSVFERMYGGSAYAGGYLKEPGLEHWLKPNEWLESSYNRFKAIPGGERDDMGKYNKKGSAGVWWSEVDPRKEASWVREIASNSTALRRRKADDNSVGYSVRCVKNQD